jgi:hypothetical protein
VRGNLEPDRDAAEGALIDLVASGAARRTPLGDDALWSLSISQRPDPGPTEAKVARVPAAKVETFSAAE